MSQKAGQLVLKPRRRSRRPPYAAALEASHEGGLPAVATTVTPSRLAPRLRRSFPPLEPEREAFLRERNREAFEEEPCRADLERRLLELGGTLALLFLPDPYIGELLDGGRYFPGARALMQLGEPSDCHANAAMLFVETNGAVRITFGYALSPDGLWRQHSWGLAVEDGRIIETTERRVRYYGLVLDDDETLQWLVAEAGSGHLWRAEVEDVRRFIRESYDLPAEHLDRIDQRIARPGRWRRRVVDGPARSPGRGPGCGTAKGFS